MKERLQSVWITGASSGIGAALSEYYAKPGATLALLGRRKAELRLVAERCRAKGAIVYEYLVDVCDVEKLRKSGAHFIEHAGMLDIVIANAGVRGEEDDDFSDWRIPEEIIRTNYLGVINTFSSFIPFLKKQGSGQLVIISSIAAYRGTPNSGAYSASKAAVNVWGESLRLRLMPFGITVTTICLGFVNTAMTKGLPFWMPGILSPEKAAELIGNSISNKKRVVTLPWQSRLIWTLFRIMPGAIYDKLIIWARAHGPKR